MRTTSFSALGRNLAAAIDSVNADHEPVIISRDRGKPAAVLMSLDDLASFEETACLLRSPRNAERLIRAVEAFEQGSETERDILE